MYVINRGIVVHGSRLLTRLMSWGDDVILSDERYFLPFNARAITYVDTSTLSRSDLLDIIKDYPTSAKTLRRATIHLALRRAVVRVARESMKARASGEISPGDEIAPRRHPPKLDSAACRASTRSLTLHRSATRKRLGQTRSVHLRGRLLEGLANALDQQMNGLQKHSLDVALDLTKRNETPNALPSDDKLGAMVAKLDQLSEAVAKLQHGQEELKQGLQQATIPMALM